MRATAGAPGPLVSVIVPSYNMGRYLAATLDSILEQDYRPLEVVVVDGASKDETVAILERYGAEHPELRWVSEPDEGPTDALNKGLAMARGDIAAIQSADDIYYPGAVRAAVDAFAAHPDVAIVYGDAEIIQADGSYQWGPTRYLPFTMRRYLAGSTFLSQSSTFFRPELAREIGGVRDRYFVFDLDLWQRILFLARRNGMDPPAHKVELVMSAYRRHEEQRDKETGQILGSYRRMIAESEDIRAAPWRDRLAARAGARILAQHYNPTGSARYQTVQIWIALLTYPPAARAIWKPRMLLPAPPTARGILGRLRRIARQGARRP